MKQELKLRWIFGLLLACLVLSTLLLGSLVIKGLFIGLLMVIAWYEFSQITKINKHILLNGFCYIFLAALLDSYWTQFLIKEIAVIHLFFLCPFALSLARFSNFKSSQEMWTVVSHSFLALFVLHVLFLSISKLIQSPSSLPLIFFIICTMSMSDVFAYFGGKRFGKRKIWPLVSPNKTVEGALCGILGSLIVGNIIYIALSNLLNFEAIGLQKCLILSVIIAILTQLGDFYESLLKRRFEVKDSGKLLPGHGGLLDRMDGCFFSFPFIYWYFLT